MNPCSWNGCQLDIGDLSQVSGWSWRQPCCGPLRSFQFWQGNLSAEIEETFLCAFACHGSFWYLQLKQVEWLWGRRKYLKVERCGVEQVERVEGEAMLPQTYDPDTISAYWGKRPGSVLTRVAQLLSVAGGFLSHIGWDIINKKLKEVCILSVSHK